MSLRRKCVGLLLLALALPAPGATSFSYRVIASKPQPRENYVQGLEIVDGQLYVSAGGYGESRLLRYNFQDGQLNASARLHPRLFAEGLTVLKDQVFQLTWRSRKVLVFSRAGLEFKSVFEIPGEGWGLTHNGTELIYSDGSDRLHFMDPQNHHISRSLKVTRNGAPLSQLNELEWVDGKVWANIYKRDEIVIIDPASGVVDATIDLAGLLPARLRRADTDVLNGIARDPADGSIWVTGKRWPRIYQIELVPAAATTDSATTTDSR